MPFKSQKQERYMNAQAAKGNIPKKVVSEFNNASKGLNLPKVARKMSELGGVGKKRKMRLPRFP